MALARNLARGKGQPAISEEEFLIGYDPDLTSEENDPDALNRKLRDQLGLTPKARTSRRSGATKNKQLGLTKD